MEGISQIARGIPRIANNTSVMKTVSLTCPAIIRKLTAVLSPVRGNNCKLLHLEVCLDTGFDNFQLFVNKKFQWDGTSTTSIHATSRLAKRSMHIIPSVGSVLQMDGLR